MRDHVSNIDAKVLIAPATYAADNTPAAVDLRDADAATLLIAVGAGGITFDATNKVEFKLTHSEDDTTYAAVAENDILNATVAAGGVVKSLAAAHAAASVTRVGYVGGKRYLKLLADFSGTHGTGTPLSVLLVRGRLTYTPAA